MTLPRALLALSALVGAASVGLPAESGDPLERGLRPGQLFPNLRLPSSEDGKLRSIQDYRGKKILLHVFASW